MTHENTRAVISKFVQVGATKVHCPAQLVFTLDHDIQNSSPAYLKKIAEIEAFAAEQGVMAYPKGRGIGHQASNSYSVAENPTPDFRIDNGGGRVCLAGHHGRSLGQPQQHLRRRRLPWYSHREDRCYGNMAKRTYMVSTCSRCTAHAHGESASRRNW